MIENVHETVQSRVGWSYLGGDGSQQEQRQSYRAMPAPHLENGFNPRRSRCHCGAMAGQAGQLHEEPLIHFSDGLSI